MFDLAVPAPYRLDRAPLVQALGQVRFPLQARLGSLDGVAGFQDAVRSAFPYLAQQHAQDFELAFGPEGAKAQVSGTTVMFQFTSDDGYTITLAPDSATLTVDSSYRGINEFTERFELMLAALVANAPVPRVDRLGVRYLDLAAMPPGDPDAWMRWFRPEVVGWPATAGVLSKGARLTNAITQVSFVSPAADELSELPADVQVVVRHGLAPAGSGVPGIPPIQVEHNSFVLDVDCFVVGAHVPDSTSLTAEFRLLHSQIDRFFHWTMTADGLRQFGLVER